MGALQPRFVRESPHEALDLDPPAAEMFYLPQTEKNLHFKDAIDSNCGTKVSYDDRERQEKHTRKVSQSEYPPVRQGGVRRRKGKRCGFVIRLS